MSPRMPASMKTVRLSCRLDAPSEDKSPNCRVRSEIEIAKALEMSDTAATMMTPERMPMKPMTVVQIARSSMIPSRLRSALLNEG